MFCNSPDLVRLERTFSLYTHAKKKNARLANAFTRLFLETEPILSEETHLCWQSWWMSGWGRQKRSNRSPTKRQKKPSLWAKKRGTCKATQLKWQPQRAFFFFIIPGVHGKNPRRTAAPASHGSSWKVWPGGKGGRSLDREESQLFPPAEKPKSPGGAAPWCVGHIKIFDRLQPYEIIKQNSVLFFHFVCSPPAADLSYYQSAPPSLIHTHTPGWPVSLFGAPRVQSGPFRSRSVCADTM